MLRPSLQEHLASLLESHGAGYLNEPMLAVAKECVNIFVNEESGPPETGGSKLGGGPDRPTGSYWPVADSNDPTSYLEFAAQLRFADIPPIDGLRMPNSGHLWIFVRERKGREIILHSDQTVNSDIDLSRTEVPPELIRRAYLDSDDDIDPTPEETYGLSLRFELGISLPFGRDSFTRLFAESDQVLEELYNEFEPSVRQGRIGGYAYNTLSGHNYLLDVELAQVGKRDFLYPFSFDTLEGLDAAIAKIPVQWKDRQDKINERTAKLQALRPKVAWIEEHKEQLNDWVPFLRLDGNDLVNLNWGSQVASLWTFCRKSDLSMGRLDRMVGESAF